MQGNNSLVGFALLIVVAICAAFMPWGAFHVAVDTPLLDGASLSLTVKAFGGHVHLPWLIVPNWLATLLIVCGAVLGMTNAKGITTFSRGVLLTPLLIAAAHCLLIAGLLMHSESVLGAGLLVTLLAAVCGAVMSMPIVPGRSRIWITLTCYHVAAASCLFFIIGYVWEWVVLDIAGDGDLYVGQILGMILFYVVFAGLIELVAYGLHRRHRWAWFVSLGFSLPLFYPIFWLVSFLGLPISLLLGLPALVCAYWGLLAPGTLAEFRPFLPRGNRTQE